MKRTVQVVGFLIIITTICFARAQSAPDVLINSGSEWKYWDDGTDPGANWKETTFNDSGWSSGAGVLGFGDASRQDTPIQNHLGGSIDSHSWYFRHQFSVPDPSGYLTLNAHLLRDDGAVVYLNGSEIFRSEMPTGTIGIETPASSVASGSEETTFYPTTCIPNQLISGNNVLAVEVHQRSLGSSDVSFDFQLHGNTDVSLVRGPYLQNQTPTSITIRWRTCVPTTSRLQWGFSPDNLNNVIDQSSVNTDHEIAVSGLPPGDKIFYSIGTATEVLAGGDADHFFVQPPNHGVMKKSRVWVLGDSGTADQNAAAVRDAYYDFTHPMPTDLWLMLGDNAYNHGTDMQYQHAVFDMYPRLLRQSTLWPTMGNHDDYSADSITETGVYYDIFSLPDAAASTDTSTGVDSGTEAYYSFDYANIHFVVLESDETNATFRTNMKTWLTGDLIATNADWVIALWHHPPYTMGSHNSDSESQLVYMREQILPILDAQGVDLVLTGHSHSYERSALIDGHYGLSDTFDALLHAVDNGDGRVTGDGPYWKPTIGQGAHEGAVYVVNGSSGKTSGVDSEAPHEALRNVMPLQVLGSVVLDFDAHILDVTFLEYDGDIGDRFRLIKELDNDGVGDHDDNCIDIVNPDQFDLDHDGMGNLCDDDVDGDQILNSVDTDDDNDYLSDEEEAVVGTNSFNPDTDHDGILDGLDVFPQVFSNICTGRPARLKDMVDADVQCAAPDMVIIEGLTNITATGHLEIFAQQSHYGRGFKIESGGCLTVMTIAPQF